MVAAKESCSTKTNLLSEWQNAARDYANAVSDLSRNIGVVPKSKYENLAQVAEMARRKSLEAKATLEAHTKAHGCDREVAA
jgi:hypothetical protein